MLVCRKNRSIRSSRMAARLASTEASSRRAMSSIGGVPSRHLEVIRTPAGNRPSKVSATTFSQLRYIGAVSIKVMPPSTAALSVAVTSPRLVGPQASPIPPPPIVSRLTGPNGPRLAVRIPRRLGHHLHGPGHGGRLFHDHHVAGLRHADQL